jgi:dynein heavy chain 1
VDPDQISWDALRTLISQSIFGGKIDNEYDQKILASLVDKFFCASSFDQDFPLFGEKEDEGVLKMPSAKTYNEFDTWIKEISLTESPMWSGLPNNAETLVNIRKAEQLVADFKVIQAAGEDEVIKRKKSGEKKDTGKAKWILILQKKCETLLGLMPEKLETMKRTEEAIKNPLFRFLEREVTVAASILKKVKNDLAALIAICREEAKWTNELHKIADSLNQDKPPETWLQYKVHLEISAAAWINDFIKRVEQLQELKTQDDFGKQGIWFGGLLFPEAYLTAT